MLVSVFLKFGYLLTVNRSDTLNSASESISNGCSAEISDGNQLITGANTVISQYPVCPLSFSDYAGLMQKQLVRAMLCQRYTSNGTYCVPSVLGNVQVSVYLSFLFQTLRRYRALQATKSLLAA